MIAYENENMTIKLANGHISTYKIYDGVYYDQETPDEVVHILARAMRTHQRIRIFYGDKSTGKCWLEEYDTIGYIARTGGKMAIPILINRNGSSGGGAIITANIVRITIDKQTVYSHPKYHTGTLTILPVKKGSELAKNGYSFGAFVNGINHANFKSKEKAEKWVAFIQGKRNQR